MASTDNLEEFLEPLAVVSEALPGIVRDVQVVLLLAAYDFIIGRSPVQTGAYRASHVLMTGETRPATFVYEHPSRPNPEVGLPGQGYGAPPLDPPDVEDAKAQAAEIEPFGTLWIANFLFYALSLEYGTRTSDPIALYGLGEQMLEHLTETAQDGFDERLRTLAPGLA